MVPYGPTSPLGLLFFPIISERKKISLSDLDQLPAADLYTWFEDIPSDNECIQSNCDTDDDNSIDMEIDLTDEDNIQFSKAANEDLNWDSEDELPLTAFLPVRNTAPHFTWTKSLNNIVVTEGISTCSGQWVDWCRP